ncbi:MAG: hypothetical protein ABI416_15805 [Ginsengibacter sp.]
MKKYILIVLVMLGSLSGIKAQDGDGDNTRAEKIQALKIAFITNKLQLTPGEAQKFWPVYNQYDNEIRRLPKGGDVITSEQKLVDIRKKYKPEFDKVIGSQKLNNLFNAERDFRDILIRRLQNRNQQRLNSLRR